MPSDKKQVILGCIVKHSDGIGFKITCQNEQTANHIKDMMRWILISENRPVIYKLGYYDKYDKEGWKDDREK